jgi:hypothetical protein
MSRQQTNSLALCCLLWHARRHKVPNCRLLFAGRKRSGVRKKKAPIHVASRRERVDVVQLLLEHGANADARDDDERSLLHLASDGGHVNVAQALLEDRAYRETPDK